VGNSTQSPRESPGNGGSSPPLASQAKPYRFGVVDLIGREGNVLLVRGVDALDGTPVLDIKPYSPEIDCVPEATGGWRIKK
jgi:tRNA (Thr-GGU) A37 N-methylase